MTLVTASAQQRGLAAGHMEVYTVEPCCQLTVILRKIWLRSSGEADAFTGVAGVGVRKRWDRQELEHEESGLTISMTLLASPA